MDPREVVLITGANTGLGFQIVRALCGSDRAYDIILSGRSPTKVEEAIASAMAEFASTGSKLYPLQLDIEHDDSVQKAFEEVQSQFGRVDALVNNAGAMLEQKFAAGQMTEREMWNQSWNINVAGTQIMTSTFIPLLLRASHPRLLFMASGTSSFIGTENTAAAVNKYPPKGWPKSTFAVPAYRSSKTGMNMMMREWHRMLHEDGVKVWCISPGLLATGLGPGAEIAKKMGAGDPVVAGPFVRSVLEGSRDDDVGKVITRDGVQQW